MSKKNIQIISMHKINPHQFLWHVRHGVRQLGWVGVVGIGLWFFVLLYYFSAVRPASSRLDELHAQADSLDKLTHKAGNRSASVSEQLSAFHEFFPKARQSPELLAKISAMKSPEGY